MKIICIEGNYRAQSGIRNVPSYPVFFIKPESSVVRNRLPFFIPEHAGKIIPRVNVALKINRLGKMIQEKFAHLYYDSIGIGVDMEAFDIASDCKEKGLPWEIAKDYDNSAPVSGFVSIDEFKDLKNLSFSILKNGNCISKTNTSEMIFSFDKIISHVSKYITIKMGDFIFTGSPETNESIEINDEIECYIEDKRMLWFNVK